MVITVRIPEPLRKLTDGKDEVNINAASVGELLENLEKSYTGIRERICDETGNVRRFINIYVNDEDVRFLNHLTTPLKDKDVVSIIPMIAGGGEIQKKVYLTFPQRLITEPIIYRVGHEFKIVTNIRGASVSDDVGLVALEISGEEEEVRKAIEWLREKGVKVEPIEQDIVE